MADEEKKAGIDIEKLLSMSKVTGINVHDFISKDMKKKLEKKYGKVFFPMLGLVIEKDKQFFFLFHESEESIKENKVFMLSPSNIDDKKIKEFADFIKKKKGD